MADYGLTPQGPNIKRLDVILEEMHSGLSEKWGVNTRQNPESLLNHLLTNVADAIADLWEFGEAVYFSQYPATAEGRSLDNAAQYGGSTREAAAKSYYRYYVDVPVTEAAETQFPNVALHKAALETAKNAGLCPTVQTLAGALRFWAKRSPDEDMEATIALVSPGASSSGGGGGSTYVLPVATATRLGGVKIGKGISVAADGTITASTSGVSPDDMASTEDTESMLDEVFPSEDENPYAENKKRLVPMDSIEKVER